LIEQLFELSGGEERTVTKIAEDENMQLFRMVFHQNEGLPPHITDTFLYLAVMRGTLSITVGRQKPHEYVFGCLLKIPKKTKIRVINLYEDVLEIIVAKYPKSPHEYQETY